MQNIHIENFELLKNDLLWYTNFCNFKFINTPKKNIKFIQNCYNKCGNCLTESYDDKYEPNILINNEICCTINYYDNWDNMYFKDCWLFVEIKSPSKKYCKNMSYQPSIIAERLDFKIIKINNKYYYSGSNFES